MHMAIGKLSVVLHLVAWFLAKPDPINLWGPTEGKGQVHLMVPVWFGISGSSAAAVVRSKSVTLSICIWPAPPGQKGV